MKKKTIFNIICIICIIVFITLLVIYNMGKLSKFDNFVYKYVSYYQNDFLTNFALLLSFLCSSWFIMLACVLIMIIFENKKIGFYTSLSAMSCYIINIFIKNIVMRPRPVDINLINEAGYSFPSGHSMGAIAFYGFLIYVVSKSDLNKKIKNLIYVVFSLIIILIGLSRIYLGVHYASDVLAGFSLSLALMIIYVHIVNLRENK